MRILYNERILMLIFVINRLEKYLFYLLLFSIPFSIRKILYFEGWRFNEWQSVSVYFTDILVILLFVFWGINYLSRGSKFSIFNLSTFAKASVDRQFLINFQCLKIQLRKPGFYLVLLLIFSAISIKNSSNMLVSWFQWGKLLEFILLFFYLKNYAIKRFGFTNSLFAIFGGGILQSVIAIAQFIRQESIGLKYLGESVFNYDFTGVASFYLPAGEKIIRAYGTMPHPNVLAGYLFWALFAFYFIWFYKKFKFDYLRIVGYILTFWAFLLTFSRVAIFVLGANFIVRGAFLFFKFEKFKGKRLWRVMLITGMVVLSFTVIYWPEIWVRINISGQEESVQLRNLYNKESLSIISWTGVGLGNFVNDLMERSPYLPYYFYQPVHNIYLLILAETGILGLSTFILFLIFLIRDFVIRTKVERFHHYSLIFVVSSFLFMGFFDHFLWTLQQGRFLLWFTLALMAIKEDEDIDIDFDSNT